MDGTRFRLVGLLEWLVAAACVLGALVLGLTMSGEVQHVRPVVPVIAGAADAPVVPANVRPGSTSVPELLFPDGKRLQLHARASTLSMLGPPAQSGPTSVERLDGVVRESHHYRYAGVDFDVVTANDEIVAIYR